MILTTKNNTAWEIVETSLTRWRIEGTIRFEKQEFDMENISLLTYKSLKNMYALLMGVIDITIMKIDLLNHKMSKHFSIHPSRHKRHNQK